MLVPPGENPRKTPGKRLSISPSGASDTGAFTRPRMLQNRRSAEAVRVIQLATVGPVQGPRDQGIGRFARKEGRRAPLARSPPERRFGENRHAAVRMRGPATCVSTGVRDIGGNTSIFERSVTIHALRSRQMRNWISPLTVMLFLLGVTRTDASIVNELEVGGTTNNSIPTAEAISGASFTLPVPATVFNPPGWKTASILGTGDNASDVDFFSFTTGGGGAIFDIDDTPYSFDTVLSLFNSAGTLVGYDDDSLADAGSADKSDSLLGVISLAAGTYYVAVSQYPNFPSAITTPGLFYTNLYRPDGLWGGYAVSKASPGVSTFDSSGPDGTSPYTLHVSLQSPLAVPEPSTLVALTGLLGMGLIGYWWRKRKREG
jgi:hypothetical protein